MSDVKVDILRTTKEILVQDDSGNKTLLRPGTGLLDASGKALSSGDTFIKPYRTTDGLPVNNSTVLVADPVLKFSIGANEVWEFHSLVFWANVASFTRINFDFTGPAAPGIVALYFHNYNGDDSGISAFSADLVGSGNGGLDGTGPAQFNVAKIDGFIKNGVNAGIVQLRSAQASAVADDQKLLAGSFIIAHKLSA